MANVFYHGQQVRVNAGPLVGLKICALGDSNTQYMGENLNDRVVALTGCASVRNEGHAGCKWGAPTNDPTYIGDGHCISMVNQLCNPYISKGYADQYDIITIMYGTNGDVNGLGDSTSTDVSTTWGAMKYCFDKLLYYYRYGKIGVLLPPQRAGGIMTESVEAIKECCELYSIPYYDISGQGQIPRDTAMPYSIAEQGLSNQGYGQIYFADNVHFGGTGREQYYHKYARFLERLV